jgi:hypothetical protein
MALLSAMITPAVLISACGLLILSTSARLARVMDRVRLLGRGLQSLVEEEQARAFAEERRRELERQIALQSRRGRLIQRSLTGFYVALCTFVGTAIAIGLARYVSIAAWLPAGLGILGTLFLFYGCVLLVGEARLALRSIEDEIGFAARLREMYQTRQVPAPPTPGSVGETSRGPRTGR